MATCAVKGTSELLLPDWYLKVACTAWHEWFQELAPALAGNAAGARTPAASATANTSLKLRPFMSCPPTMGPDPPFQWLALSDSRSAETCHRARAAARH